MITRNVRLPDYSYEPCIPSNTEIYSYFWRWYKEMERWDLSITSKFHALYIKAHNSSSLPPVLLLHWGFPCQVLLLHLVPLPLWLLSSFYICCGCLATSSHHLNSQNLHPATELEITHFATENLENFWLGILLLLCCYSD